jgi:hypothetical protein
VEELGPVVAEQAEQAVLMVVVQVEEQVALVE